MIDLATKYEAYLPQHPFVAQSDPKGPSFLDTGACICALQRTPAKKSEQAAWQCIGNQTQGVYATTTGKWFKVPHSEGKVGGPINDDSNPPATKKPMVWKSGALRELSDKDKLSIYDKACTGENQTTFSTAFYRVREDENAVETMPCWRPAAMPIKIQEAEDWDKQGCREGFLCANNTVNSLPQFCPPLEVCQQGRLSGQVCALDGENKSMGPFEPVICTKGHYCPLGGKGAEMIECPSGTYCQPGAATPTNCLAGSYCPKGSSYEVGVIPIILLILVDILLVIGVLMMQYRSRLRTARETGSQSRLGALKRAMTVQVSRYQQLEDSDEDHEMVPMRDAYVPNRQASATGFAAALDRGAMRQSRLQEPSRIDDPQLRAFVDSMRKATDASSFGLSFGYSNLRFQPKGIARPILQRVTGQIKTGTLTAVMGGSGAGKSTFVNVLMGKTNHTGGVVTVNGSPGKVARYKKVIGYVPQDDVVLPELTVYENIVHSAKVRLPRTWSNIDIEAHVDAVVDCLELSHVRNSMVGTVAKPVISGGQRKRVSIGMELAAAPMAIFLDEPTSGLDATAASSMLRTLEAIARLGITIIVIIHQPRAEIFEMFDRLILLGNGQTIYQGLQSDVEAYFEGLGYHFPEHCNGGDVLTDIITGNGREYKPNGSISKETLISSWAAHQKAVEEAPDDNRNSKLIDVSLHKALKERGAPRLLQVWINLCRAMLQQSRAKTAFFGEMGLAALAGFLLGLAQNSSHGIHFKGLYNEPYSILSTATDYSSAPQMALLVAIAIGLVAAAPGVKILSEETMLHRREAEAGHSRIAYFVAKVLSAFPRMIVGCLHFSAPMLLLSTPIIAWYTAFAANLVYFYCIYGLASVVSMIVRREDAPLLATMMSLIVGILSGAAPSLSKVKQWHLEWLWRMSPGTWLGELYFGQLVKPREYLYNIELASRITGYHLDWLWSNVGVLAGIGTAYRLIAFAAMVILPKFRRR